ncbi:titin homolog isoform X2 [Phlebotomus papatasi]|uniref:titin homolog isoform X2 n=1 Tax=Phlebotomus papatasi TaxID=29031 RepID=UPI0024838386|nr:titin homolog isoform X2 [Phlebotomus papatasi]
MGRKSKAKANRNNQQDNIIVQKTNQTATNSVPQSASEEVIPNTTSALESSKNLPEQLTPLKFEIEEKATENVQEAESPSSSFTTSKKKRNRNKNKKKNQHTQEAEAKLTVSEVIAQKDPQDGMSISEQTQNKDEKPEETLNVSSDQSKSNKAENAERTNQEASVDENRMNEVVKDFVENTDEIRDRIVEKNREIHKNLTELSPQIEVSEGLDDKSSKEVDKKIVEDKIANNKKPETRGKAEKGQEEGSQSQKTNQKENQKKAGKNNNKNTKKDFTTLKLLETKDNNNSEPPQMENIPKTDNNKELKEATNTTAQMDVPVPDPITVQISQPLVITPELCKNKLEELSTESTLAQLIELVSNTDIPLQDICPVDGKEKMAEFQKPIAETGAALKELVNVVASIEVMPKNVQPIAEDKSDKVLKNKKGKPQKINHNKSSDLQKPVQDAKKLDSKNKDVKLPGQNKDNKHTKDAKLEEDIQEKSIVDEKVELMQCQKMDNVEIISQIEDHKPVMQEDIPLISEENAKNENKTDLKELSNVEESEVKQKTSPKITNDDLPPITSNDSVELVKEKITEAPEALETKLEKSKGNEIEINKLPHEVTKTEAFHKEDAKKNSDEITEIVSDPDSIRKSLNTTPTTSKRNKEDLNIKEANEKNEAKAKESPEKNPQEKMDAITFVPDKLIDILDTKMQTPSSKTGAIKKIPKQKDVQGKESCEMAAQTQITVLPTFEDKIKIPEELKVSQEPKKTIKHDQQKQEKSNINTNQKTSTKSTTSNLPKKPEIPPKPEHLDKKSPNRQDNVKKTVQGVTKKPQILSDDEDVFIEYKFTPRQVFLATICQVCKIALQNPNTCPSCLMVSYCSEAHSKEDAAIHQQLCQAIQEIARKRGGHVYNNAKILSNDDFRNLRVHTLNLCESLTQRTLLPFEKEILLFPRICCTPTCREWRPSLLTECKKCGQISYCKDQPNHCPEDHQRWCPFFLLYQKLIIRQKNTGRIEPTLPSRIFLQRYELPSAMEEVFRELYKNNTAVKDDCTYATLTQLATAPLTAFYALQKTVINVQESLTIHLIGAELQFEGDTLDKWEAFFLHLIPQVLELRVVFIGPELNAENLPLDILSRIRMCRTCRQSCRGVKFDFQCGKLYHDYTKQPVFTKPDLICFFNPGLYRTTGFSGQDTWPDTIKAATSMNCPILVTSYTEFESPQDLAQLHRNSTRPLNLIQAPAVNPFSSQRPERNFISDEVSPMIFKNYFAFIVS